MAQSYQGFTRPSVFYRVFVTGGLLLLGLAGCDKPATSVPAPIPEVKVLKVEPKTLDVVITRLAQLQSSREVDVVARVSGFLERMVYKEGALLQEGDVMFEMDKRPFQAQVDAAKGELEASKARLWTANANLKRIKPLTEADAMSQSDLDQAIGAQRSAEAAVFSAKAKLSNAELDLSYTTLHAPVTGLSGASLQREGSYLNSIGESAYLSYVAQIDPIWVNFAVSQNEIESFRQERQQGNLIPPENSKYEFEIIMTDGSVYPLKGALDFASPSFDTRTGTFLVRAVVPNPDFLLRPGMFVSTNILGGKRQNAIVVPQQAVQQQGNTQMVMLVNEESKVVLQPVTVGEWEKDQWLITSGLKGGDMVIVEGFMKIRPGMNVKALHYLPKAKMKSDTEDDKADKPTETSETKKTEPSMEKKSADTRHITDNSLAVSLVAN
ncbi:efflux RND transporter periplasmic adaptor subunit [Aestuariirhabdus haliotis]|uniref:efflux RND transporter periplasmic adaptor subunit n=1 Tax=Aestuariirhabdus haliotis TaxID=2918751 RepID=UPI0020BFFB30|nr:efflux RND transporter periplasmic adaptor subunit [Aestuariirhabdus haliotis]MCL6421102.1 efflux RND transporter periplasmic adaptor subunit [Aestuariirhabdus haliotis]